MRTALPHLWASPHGFLHRNRLLRQAAEQSAAHAVPMGVEELTARLDSLREKLTARLHLHQEPHPLDLEFHGDIAREGYKVQRVSFASGPGIRVTGNLYLPDGKGPFPAVVNLHGHWSQGKLAAQVQERGHALAQVGIVTLTVDAAGAGERAEVEREWSYHGAAKAAELFLAGDSLLGLQVRDNRRALDVLQALPMVAGEKLGATGASGGGNQTMWLAALDDRVKAAVPVVSVGSFQSYVGACNCMCETLPGGLTLAEEWMVLGLIAPRALLIMNALHDQPAFAYGPMSSTCRQVEEVFSLQGARERFDSRLIDMTHGYWPAPRRAMVNWMKFWLAGDSDPVSDLVDENPIPEEELLCYLPGERPAACGYGAVRKGIADEVRPDGGESDETQARADLAQLVGWKMPADPAAWTLKRTLGDGLQVGSVVSPSGLPLPVVTSADWDKDADEIQLFLSPEGKSSSFVMGRWEGAVQAGVLAVAVDLPAVGELAWEPDLAGDTRFHDSARGALWLGDTLVGEWAGAVAAVCQVLREKSPHARIQVLAEREAVFAALLAQALHPCGNISLAEFDCPPSLRGGIPPSLAWCVPGFLRWGDLDRVRALTGMGPETL